MTTRQFPDKLQWTFAAFIALAAAFITGGYLFYQTGKSEITREKSAELAAIADLKVQQITAWRKEREGNASVIQNNRIFTDHISDYLKSQKGINKKELLDWMYSLINSYSYKSIFLMDMQNRIILTTDKNGGFCPFDLPNAPKAMNTGKAVFSDMEKCTETAVHIDQFVPIPDSRHHGSAVGVLVLRIDPKTYLLPIIQSWPTPSPTAETFLARREGNDILYLTELRDRKNSAMSFRVPLSSKQSPASVGTSVYRGTATSYDYRGKEVLAAMRPIPGTPWFMVAKVDTTEVFASIQRYAFTIIILDFLLIVTAGACINFIWRKRERGFYRTLYLESKRAEEALQENQRILSTLLGNLPGMAYRCRNDSHWTMEFVSEGCFDLTGYTPEELTNNRKISYIELIVADDRDYVWNEVQARIQENRPYELSYRIITAEGEMRWVWEKGIGVFSPTMELIALEGFINDVTEHKNLENQLRFAQKLEAVGVLSGGIAHDFNNIVNVIIGYATLIEMENGKDSPIYPYIEQILDASDRATKLVKSLLAFSRKQILDVSAVNMNDIMERMKKLLMVLIREDIELKISQEDNELWLMADSGQIEQVLINLTTNAVDAMPHGGVLAISTSEINLEQEFVNLHGYGKTGRYALITFSDTGHGMEKSIRHRIFEPFFTTKEVGKGTGLGLSIIYGIIKQHNGFINCYSEPSMGTTFKIYLPLIDAGTGQPEILKTLTEPKCGTETILLAEDDDQLRNLTKNLLERHGYTVITALDGDDAIAKFEQNLNNIHLTILDVIMPKKNGKEVCEEILKINPLSKVLFTSGYPEDIFNRDEIVAKGLDFIAKPVIPADMMQKVKQLLERDNF